MKFGEALVYLMAEQGVKPSELAKRTGIVKSTISELTSGRSQKCLFDAPYTL